MCVSTVRLPYLLERRVGLHESVGVRASDIDTNQLPREDVAGTVKSADVRVARGGQSPVRTLAAHAASVVGGGSIGGSSCSGGSSSNDNSERLTAPTSTKAEVCNGESSSYTGALKASTHVKDPARGVHNTETVLAHVHQRNLAFTCGQPAKFPILVQEKDPIHVFLSSKASSTY